MLSCDLRRLVATALVFSTVLVTMPVSAADFGSSKSVIGSVSAVGPVELRGIGISQEGTLFAGDSIRAGQKGYAKILLGTGSKIELSEKTAVNVNRDAQGVKIAMNTGTIGFTASTPLRIDVMPFEITATDASGNVAIMSATTAGVRAINGKVTVRNLKTSESFVVLKGQERLLGLQNGAHAPALAQVASNVPGPVPMPQTPAGKTTGGLAMDTGAWLAVAGGAALAGIAIWALVEAKNNNDDVDALKASNAAQLKAISNASILAATVSQLQAQQATVQALASQAQAALTVAGNATAAAQAGSLAAQAASLQTTLAGLQSQLAAAQATIAAGGTATLPASAVSSAVTSGNSIAASTNALLTANANTPGVPKTTISPVSQPTQASASVPA